jgi:hypothetical protein
MNLPFDAASRSTVVNESIGAMARLLADLVVTPNGDALLGPDLTALADDLCIPRGMLLRGVLVSDFARVAQIAMAADDEITEAERRLCFPLFYTFANFVAAVRSEYNAFLDLQPHDLIAFLTTYVADSGPFGFCNERTRFVGLEVCRRAAQATGDAEALELYTRTQLRLMDDVFALGELGPQELAARAQLRDILELRQRLVDSADEGDDPRAAAFCSPDGPDVFAAVAHAHQVWERDPFDVESVHIEAREAFERLVDRVTNPEHHALSGRMLLVRGESGSGKTHLMRAFRNRLHARRLGYAGYMQMSSRTDDYARYALTNLVDSLERPYDPPVLGSSGLMTISDRLAENRDAVPSDSLARLRDGDFDLTTDDFVSPLVDRILAVAGYDDFDPDLLRAFLYLQRREPRIRARVLKYLRCEHLNPYDTNLLGGIASRDDAGAPHRTLVQLGKLIWRTGGGALVLLVDQMEDITNFADAKTRIPRAIDVLRHVVDDVHSSIVVLSCLDDLYKSVKSTLAKPAIDRLELDPPPLQLSSARESADVEAIVARRLEVLFERSGVRFRPDDPLYPFARGTLGELHNQRTRDVLAFCHAYQRECIEVGRLVDEHQAATPVAVAEPRAASVELEQAWNDFRAAFAGVISDDDDEQVRLLSDSLVAVCQETDPPLQLHCVARDGTIAVDDDRGGALLVALVNRDPRGGGLQKQIDRAASLADRRKLVLVRSSEYPSSPRAVVVQRLGQLVAAGARALVIEDGDWRTMLAFERFFTEHRDAPGLARWRREERPLGQLASLREIARLDEARPTRRDATTATAPTAFGERARANPTAPTVAAQPEPAGTLDAQPSPANVPPPPTVSPASTASTIEVGATAGLIRQPVTLRLDDLKTHVAFLGSTGSGKTTLALNVIERALLAGVPALLIDRKGDLCSYGRRAWWEARPDDEAAAIQKATLAQRVKVDIYTPGSVSGRGLVLPIVPAGLGDASTADRNVLAQQAAAGLAAMMGFRTSQKDQAAVTILAKAIELLGKLGEREITLARIIAIVADRDPALVAEIGHLDTKRFAHLTEALEILSFNRASVLNIEGDPLDVDRLFSRDGDRTRLSVISTKFLGDGAAIEFWISRLLVELERWATRRPSSTLQAIVMFDEADLYMPAQSKPATKEPMQGLLKRARSAGLALFLATQSPGDLDYRSRDNILTWFVGRVAEPTAIGKMRALLAECRTNIERKIGTQGTGEFFMLRGGQVTEMKARQSLMVTEQLREDEILALSRAGLGHAPA